MAMFNNQMANWKAAGWFQFQSLERVIKHPPEGRGPFLYFNFMGFVHDVHGSDV